MKAVKCDIASAVMGGYGELRFEFGLLCPLCSSPKL